MCMLSHASTVGATECNWTDQGPEFCAEVTQELARIQGIAWTFTLAYRPQSNGIVERQSSEILRRLRVLLLYKDTWNCWSKPHVIALVQLALNTRVHGSTGYAAVELTFGTAASNTTNPLTHYEKANTRISWTSMQRSSIYKRRPSTTSSHRSYHDLQSNRIS
jgi:hypothetical protein